MSTKGYVAQGIVDGDAVEIVLDAEGVKVGIEKVCKVNASVRSIICLQC